MPRTCTVCAHADCSAIDQALVSHQPYRHIAAQRGLSASALVRHHDEHLPATLAKAAEAEDVAHAIDVLAQLKAINAATLSVLAEARRRGDGDLALKAVDRIQRQIELQAKLLGELDERPQVNVLIAPEWLTVRSALLDALRAYPEARSAVAASLLALEAPVLAELAADLALALDPTVLAERAGLAPDPWQRDVLRSSAPRLLLNCSRQSGKSTTAATLAVHTAVYQPDSLVLLLSPALRQSQELFRKCLDVYRVLDHPTPPAAESALRLELGNGSRIVSLPGKEGTIRGYSGVRLLLIDEASRVADDLYRSVRPMLAVSGGRLVAMSTPFGTRGWWYEAWQSSEPWERVEVPATQVPRIAPEFLAEEERSLGRWWYEQEYLCRFLDAHDAVFRRADIDAAFTDDIAPLFGGAAPGGIDPWAATPTP